MTPCECWLATLNRKKANGVPCNYWATPEATHQVLGYLGINSPAAMFQQLHIDPIVDVGPRNVVHFLPPDEDVFGTAIRTPITASVPTATPCIIRSLSSRLSRKSRRSICGRGLTGGITRTYRTRCAARRIKSSVAAARNLSPPASGCAARSRTISTSSRSQRGSTIACTNSMACATSKRGVPTRPYQVWFFGPGLPKPWALRGACVPRPHRGVLPAPHEAHDQSRALSWRLRVPPQ